VFSDIQLLNQLFQGSGGSLNANQIDGLIKGLPHIDEKRLADLGEQGCPICLTPYLALIAEEELALAMESPAQPVDTLGITKLSQPWQCGHMFCRRDISKWIVDGHDSCPLCRHTLVERDQGRQDDENSSERLPPDTDGSNAMHAYIEGLRARVASVDEILAFGLHDPDLPRQRENTDRGAEYSGMYS
jgi:uncharacterized protein YbaR (Trm112 family)